jgi:hypothetical protein
LIFGLAYVASKQEGDGPMPITRTVSGSGVGNAEYPDPTTVLTVAPSWFADRDTERTSWPSLPL